MMNNKNKNNSPAHCTYNVHTWSWWCTQSYQWDDFIESLKLSSVRYICTQMRPFEIKEKHTEQNSKSLYEMTRRSYCEIRALSKIHVSWFWSPRPQFENSMRKTIFSHFLTKLRLHVFCVSIKMSHRKTQTYFISYFSCLVKLAFTLLHMLYNSNKTCHRVKSLWTLCVFVKKNSESMELIVCDCIAVIFHLKSKITSNACKI